MNLHVGQKVALRRGFDRGAGGPGHGCETKPVHGVVYTVREVLTVEGEGCIRLVEIENVRRHYRMNGETHFMECVFPSRCFRPAKTTSIEVFERMLAPEPNKPAKVKERANV